MFFFFFSSRRRHTRFSRDWSSDVCSSDLAARLGLASAQGMILETDAGSYQSRCQTPGERAELRLAPVPAPGPVPGLATADGEQRAAFGIVGVPHLVVLVDDVGRLDIMGRGHALRFDPALGAGSNRSAWPRPM